MHTNDGKKYVWRAGEPHYLGDVLPIPLNLEPAAIKPTARVITSGSRILVIGKSGPWGYRPVWDVLGEIHDYLRDNIMIPFKPFFVKIGANG